MTTSCVDASTEVPRDERYRQTCVRVRQIALGIREAAEFGPAVVALYDGAEDLCEPAMRKAVAWWESLKTYRDRNGQLIAR